MQHASQAALFSLIGNTPLMEVTRIDTGPCQLFLKLESQNPGGSIKDRIGLAMIAAAEADGRLQPGGVVVEATAGNTGIGLALVARIKGYRVVLVVPDKMAVEKILHLKALGAEIHLTRSDVGKGHPEYYQDYAARLAREIPGAWFADQFNNAANPLAHQSTTGPELWQQTDARPRCDRGRHRLGRHAGRPVALFRRRAAAARIRAGRSEGLDPGRVRAYRPCVGGVRLVGGGRHRRRLHSVDRRPVAGPQRLHHHRRGKLPDRAPAAARGRHPGRLVVGHAAGRGAQVLPRADDAEAGRHVRLRHRHALPEQGVQRRLDVRPGPAGAPAPGRPARPDRAPLRRRRCRHRVAHRHPADRVQPHAQRRPGAAAGDRPTGGWPASSTNPTCCCT